MINPMKLASIRFLHDELRASRRRSGHAPGEVARRRQQAFTGKQVAITGASSGIGRELALLCAELGASPILVARREKELGEVAAAVRDRGGRAAHYVADLSDKASCDAAIEAIHAAHGHVDVLVNNAGRSIRRPAVLSIERFHDYERTMQLNFFGALRMIHGCLPQMRARRSGAIVNVLSAGTRMPSPNFSAYMASKAALASLTDTLAAELVSEGIHCAGIYLPWVRTDMMGDAFTENTRVMTPRRAAEWIVDSVADRRRDMVPRVATRRFITNLVAPGLITRLLNVVWRISTDDDGANPEFAPDRELARRFVKGRLM